jgi:amidohydrolase/hippurate hydrolase
MLQAKPGCYIWLGGGRGPDTPNLHNPHYDFNDDALQIGASYWVTLAEQQLPVAAEPVSRPSPSPASPPPIS